MNKYNYFMKTQQSPAGLPAGVLDQSRDDQNGYHPDEYSSPVRWHPNEFSRIT